MKKIRAGFVLYEVIIYLFITSICFFTIYNELIFTKHFFNHDSIDEINWHSSMMKLDDMLFDSEIIKVQDSGIIFKTGSNFKEPGKTYQMEKYKDMLRISGSSAGHMPILTKISKIKFAYKNDILYMIVTRKNKKNYEYVDKIKEKSIGDIYSNHCSPNRDGMSVDKD